MSEEYRDTNAATDGAENPTAVEVENTSSESTENATESVDNMVGIIPPRSDKNATQRDAGGKASVYVHRFRKPFEYEGKKYSTLNFYFERLTTNDMITVENEMLGNSEYALDPLLSRNYQILLASRASGVGSDVLRAMPFNDGYKISTAARDFLIDSGF